ncbi:uncharacterized protein At5g03900, chloroplastic-like [Rutidosis leptorrhynchoides]|uniref:uncharacterized protein At5g03900, chloroplastic-like n=1 Tax=Rutidosis leptorrhynchoides TaxID=125765 RepID=UPI003A99DD47
MASISTCFKVTPNHHSKLSSLNPSRQFHYSLRTHHVNFRNNFLNLGMHNSNSLSSVLKNRASSEAPSVEATPRVSPGKIIESDKLLADVRNRTMDAVDKCGRRVTVGDVATVAGITLIEAQKALQAIAADTNGFLEVSNEGDVLYVYPKDYRSKLAAKSLRIRTEPYIDKAKSGAEFLIRVTFGTALIASILIVFTAIIAILTSASSKKDRKRRRSSFGSLRQLYPSPSDLFRMWKPHHYSRPRHYDGDSGMNFIEPVFSFVFGDGNPNEGIEEVRWKLIGQYIGSNGGVVTAEELAPYLDVETAEKMDDDPYMLPVLLRFNGQPQVDEVGNILYSFPSLQRTGTSNRDKKEDLGRQFCERVGGTMFLKEKKWAFSKTSNTERAWVSGLGGINLFGVIVLGTLLKDIKIIEPDGFISFVIKIFPLLQLYATSFFAIPLVRWYIALKTNAKIEKRNRARELRAQALNLPDNFLRQKILSAREMSKKTVIGQDEIVYTTKKDVSEQEYDTQEWDRRFQDIKNSN